MKKCLYISGIIVLTALLITGCASKRDEHSVASDAGAISAEPAAYVYGSLDTLLECIREGTYESSEETAAKRDAQNSFTHIYAPSADSFPGFVLFQILERPGNNIQYFYYPADLKLERYADGRVGYYENNKSIIVTYDVQPIATIESVAQDQGLTIAEDGYIYDDHARYIHFTAGSSVVSVNVHDHLELFDTIKSVCTMEKITIEKDAAPDTPDLSQASNND